ncbi:MAG: hypothetical protein M1830_010616 [Pleopsidium flavum]|nr:MAG: hypothetical protein M1830_010616 [Pleopsidium flavum]
MHEPVEDDDDLLAISEDLVESPTHKPASTTIIDFDGLLTPPLKLQEDLAQGCGGQLWPAGMVLAKYILRHHRDSFKGKTILELGAGGGLVGLAVALGCTVGRPLYITDQKPMLALMRQNLALNNLQDTVVAEILDWGDAVPPTLPKCPDVILAADCVYFEPAFHLLQVTLFELIGPETVCYFCFKKRRRADLQFLKKARKMFEMREIEDDLGSEEYSRENIFLYCHPAIVVLHVYYHQEEMIWRSCYVEMAETLGLGLPFEPQARGCHLKSSDLENDQSASFIALCAELAMAAKYVTQNGILSKYMKYNEDVP